MDLDFYINDADLNFEEDLLQNPYDIKTWLRYLETKSLSEVQDPSQDHLANVASLSQRRFFLYERALKLLPGSFKLWKGYLDELQDAFEVNKSLLLNSEIISSTFERALLSLHRMPRTWLDYLAFLVKNPRENLPKIRKVFNRALLALPITQHPRLWDWIEQRCLTIKKRAAFKDKKSLVNFCPKWCKSLWERMLQAAPHRRPDYIRFLRSIEDWNSLAKEQVTLLNSLLKNSQELQLARTPQKTRESKGSFSETNPADSEESSLIDDAKDQTLQDTWDSLCQLVMEHSIEISSISVEEILRSAISLRKHHQGPLWTALAAFYLRKGNFEAARVIYEEALSQVFLVRDFAQIFDAYAKMEEALLERLLSLEEKRRLRKKKKRKQVMKESETQEPEPSTPIASEVLTQIVNLQGLLRRHSFLLNDVLLRQNPHCVKDWLERATLLNQSVVSADSCSAVRACLEEALKTANPHKAGPGEYPKLWLALADFIETAVATDAQATRDIYKRATNPSQETGVDYASVDDLASVFLAWAAFEARARRNLDDSEQAAIEIVSQAVNQSSRDLQQRVAWKGLRRSLMLWNWLIDAEEARGAGAACEAAYERLLQLKLAQPQHIINYALFLEETRQDWEGACKVYERGIELFPYPIAFEIWNIYLPKFVSHHAASRLERTRDLFESALPGCPEKFALPLYLMYGRMEEEYGLSRNVLAIYQRGCHALAPSDRPALLRLLIDKTVESQGVLAARSIYELALRLLSPQESLGFGLNFATLECQLGEFSRARALLLHLSQFCDPRVNPGFWAHWQEFEVRHGDEASFREMLRVKRSVQNIFLQKLPYVKARDAQDAEATEENDAKILENSTKNQEELLLDL